MIMPASLRPVVVAALAVAGGLRAQEPMDDRELIARIERRCESLREGDQLVERAALCAGSQPRACELLLAEPRAGRREPAEVHELARKSVCVVGAYYRCSECKEWHFDAASGFALSTDGAVATAWHVLEPAEHRGETFFVVVQPDGAVHAVRKVLAADAAADVCVLATDARGLEPLPLRPAARVGERVYCLSHPDHRFGFFSEGLIARWFVHREPLPEAAAATPSARPAIPMFEVTLDFARGSSGAPILDAAGNAVGVAQATQTVVHDEDAEHPDVQMVLKLATPAAALRSLVLGR
jgi:S1-C subfamily serine protease